MGRPLDGKVALITGAGKGIGAAISRELAASGATLVMNYAHSASQTEALAKELAETEGVGTMTIRTDVSNYDEVCSMMDQAWQRFGRIDRVGSSHDRIYSYNFLPETAAERELGLHQKLQARIKEFNDILGMDARVLDETERINPEAVYAIYEEQSGRHLGRWEAEESGLIVPIGEWVLRTACRQAEVWGRTDEPIGMAVNVSARQLSDVKEAGMDKVHFAFNQDNDKPGKPYTYRVQGPTFLIEYDNTQNDANHIHSVWRDFNGDFGEDLLREHVHGARDHHHD